MDSRITNLNLLNAKLNPICHLLALLGAHHILHISRIRVNKSTQDTVRKICTVSVQLEDLDVDGCIIIYITECYVRTRHEFICFIIWYNRDIF